MLVKFALSLLTYQSLSARRAWIEMAALCLSCVLLLVALRKESVDRNQGVHYDNYNLHVALRKESVDRNLVGCIDRAIDIMSLSARRAWIEIAMTSQISVSTVVALRKESVDRNVNLRVLDGSKSSSLSARRAWIEILTDDVSTGGKIVALRKESVDRNSPSRFGWRLSCVALRKESVDRNR